MTDKPLGRVIDIDAYFESLQQPQSPKAEVVDESVPTSSISQDEVNEADVHTSRENVYLPQNLSAFTIPQDVLSLLWFADGPLKNYDADQEGSFLDDPELGMRFTFRMSEDEEPSAIFTRELIQEPQNVMFVDTPRYYPSYRQLEPEQRWVYIKWLANIDAPIDIGYVFLFYYGVERHLLEGNYEEALKTIRRLMEHHPHSNFPIYAIDAALGGALYHQRESDMRDILETINTERMMISSPLYHYIKFFLNIPLTSTDIIAASSVVGFYNSRYVKSEYELFEATLDEKIESEYKTTSSMWDFVDINKCPVADVEFTANRSIKTRRISIPRIISEKTILSKKLRKALEETHEEVKVILRKRRSQKIKEIKEEENKHLLSDTKKPG